LALPFPWKSLDAISKADVSALHAARRWAARHLRLDGVERSVSDLVGAPVRIRLRRVRRQRDAPAFGEGYGVALEGETLGSATSAAVIQVESALAAAVVARAIDRTPARIHDASTASPAIAGALAAVLAASARRAGATIPMRVVAAGGAADLQANVERAGHEGVAVELTVTVGDEAYRARVVVAPHPAILAAPSGWTRQALSALGSMPLSLPVVAAVCHAAAADVASLRPGDALMLPQWPLARTVDGRGWVGPVLLAAPTAEAGIRAELGDEGRLVLRGDAQPLWVREAEMTESELSNAIVDAVGEIPVLIRVEIGEARMAARDWAALERGDVLALGRRIGDPVVLRVGGVPVATGELVQIDGDIGVRIVERVNASLKNP
jgi:type III secretion system YscQ/HrcQ family protein